MLTIIQLPKDCRNEIYSHLDKASHFVFRLTCKYFYHWRRGDQIITRGLREHHKRAALRHCYFAYIELFWKFGMIFWPEDSAYLGVNNVRLLRWWFANVVYTEKAHHTISVNVLTSSTNEDCVLY